MFTEESAEDRKTSIEAFNEIAYKTMNSSMLDQSSYSKDPNFFTYYINGGAVIVQKPQDQINDGTH